MNADQFQKLVAEVHERVMDTQRNVAIQDAHEALDALDAASEEWKTRTVAKRQAWEALANAKTAFEHAEAELILMISADPEVVNGSNKETRERQITAYLGDLLKTNPDDLNPVAEYSYAAAHAELGSAQVAYDQASLDEDIAAMDLRNARKRCDLIESILRALSL